MKLKEFITKINDLPEDCLDYEVVIRFDITYIGNDNVSFIDQTPTIFVDAGENKICLIREDFVHDK